MCQLCLTSCSHASDLTVLRFFIGSRYFSCKDSHGMFVLPGGVKLQSEVPYPYNHNPSDFSLINQQLETSGRSDLLVAPINWIVLSLHSVSILLQLTQYQGADNCLVSTKYLSNIYVELFSNVICMRRVSSLYQLTVATFLTVLP